MIGLQISLVLYFLGPTVFLNESILFLFNSFLLGVSTHEYLCFHAVVGYQHDSFGTAGSPKVTLCLWEAGWTVD